MSYEEQVTYIDVIIKFNLQEKQRILMEDVNRMYPFTKAGFDHSLNKDIKLNPAVLHFIRQRYDIPNFTVALKSLNNSLIAMQVYKKYGFNQLNDKMEIEDSCPFFVSPTFVEDIDLQPMHDGEFKLWTENGTL